MGDVAIGIVGQHLIHNVAYHRFEFVNKLSRTVGLLFNEAQLALPQTGKFGTFEQLFLDERNEFYAGGSGHNVLALTTDVLTLEQGFDNGSSGRRTADAVFL